MKRALIMKRALMMLSIVGVFCMALFANAYAAETFSYYGSDYQGGPVTGDSKVQHWDEGQPYFPPSASGETFNYYGAEPYTEIEPPEGEMQRHYGQAPSSTEEFPDAGIHPYRTTERFYYY